MSLELCDYITYWWEHSIERQVHDAMTIADAPSSAVTGFTKFTWRKMWLEAESHQTNLKMTAGCALLFTSPDSGLRTVVGTSESEHNAEHTVIANTLSLARYDDKKILIGILTTGNISRKSLSLDNTQSLQRTPLARPWTTIIHVPNGLLHDSQSAVAEVYPLSNLQQ